MRVLVACEHSGVVREAFRAKGHDAWSCDMRPLGPFDLPGPHIEGPVEDILEQGWDLMIAHPPCTYLCASGLHWNRRRPERAQKTATALGFVGLLMTARIPKVCIENPVGCIGTRLPVELWGYNVQYVQPYEFGDNAKKKTGLWLKGLPPLPKDPACRVDGRWVGDRERWANQTDSGQNACSDSLGRAMRRSRTYPGIALAMAQAWG